MNDFTWFPADIAACRDASAVSQVIQWATFGRMKHTPSHVAMICDWEGSPIWVESTSTCNRECVINKQQFAGCQAHRPEDRIEDYTKTGGAVEVWRLSSWQHFKLDDRQELADILLGDYVYPKKGYDFLGAVESGTRIWSWSYWFPPADLEKVFCSEMIAAVLQQLRLMNWSNPGRWNPQRLLQHLEDTGVYKLVGEFTNDGWKPKGK